MARILVVEDDPDARRLIERILASAGHKVSVIDDGAKAIDTMRSEKPDLIVLDINLPGKTGFQICQELKADPSIAGTPVVMCTAEFNTVEDAQRGLGLGAVEYVVKPFAAQVLLFNVERLLANRGS